MASHIFAAPPAIDIPGSLACALRQDRVVLDEKELVCAVIRIISPGAFSAYSPGVAVLVELERKFAGPAIYDVVICYAVGPAQNPNRIRVNLSKMTMINARLRCWRYRCSSAQMHRRTDAASCRSGCECDSSDARSLRNIDVDNHRFRSAARRIVQNYGRIVYDWILRRSADGCLSLQGNVFRDPHITRPVESACR